MLHLFSLDLFSVLAIEEWSWTCVGIGVLVGLLLGFWLGTYLTVSKNTESMESLTESFTPYHPRKPTLDPAERKAREQKDLL